MQPSIQSRKKLLYFEGFRGIAALIVVVFHLRVVFWSSFLPDVDQQLAFLPFPINRIVRAFLSGVQNGGYAVWFFWVMSAFVLSYRYFLLMNHSTIKEAHLYLEDAALRRYPRLLVPILASVLFAYLLHSLGLMRNKEIVEHFGHADNDWLASLYSFQPSFTGALKSAFWESFVAFSPTTSYNFVLWTMEKEFLGSLFLFSFLGLFGGHSSRFLLYPLVALVIFLLDICWLDAFLAGILLCDFYVNCSQCPSQTPASSSGSVVVYFLNKTPWTIICWLFVVVLIGLSNLMGVLYIVLACASVLLAMYSPATQWFLSGRVVVFLGKISFSLYLVHLPIICSFSCWLYLATFNSFGHIGAALISSVCTICLSIVSGYVLYLLADKWSIGISRLCAAQIISWSQSWLVALKPRNQEPVK